MSENIVETHPLPPFLPKKAKVLIMGTFPPPLNRWSIHFFYPNYNNDMWRIMGLLFFKNKDHFIDPQHKRFNKEEIVDFLNVAGIALSDTVYKAKRLKGNAADKFLEIVTVKSIQTLLDKLPECHTILTTGEKAMEVAIKQFNQTTVPKVGDFVTVSYKNRAVRIYRMPSSSRAYPLKLEKKAIQYKKPLEELFNL